MRIRKLTKPSIAAAILICGVRPATAQPHQSETVQTISLSRRDSANTGVFRGALGKASIVGNETTTKLFIMSSETARRRGDSQLHCLNAETGTTIWSAPIGRKVFAAPVAYEQKVFIGCIGYFLYVLNAQTGDLVWKQQLSGHIDFGPAVANGIAFVAGFDVRISALDARNGTSIWTKQLSDKSSGGPILIGDTVFCGDQSGLLQTMRVRDGRSGWTRRLGGLVAAIGSDGTHLYVPSWDGNLYAIQATTGNIVWKVHTGGGFSMPGVNLPGKGDPGGVICAPAVADGRVYAPSTRGICYCWDALTGKELWTSNTDGDARRAPALADGVLCFGTSEPDCVYGVAAATGSISWKIGMVNKVFYSPAIHRGVAYVSSGNLLYALSLESGSQLWSKSFAAEVGSPTLATYSQTLLPNVIRWVRDRGRVFFPHGPND